MVEHGGKKTSPPNAIAAHTPVKKERKMKRAALTRGLLPNSIHAGFEIEASKQAHFPKDTYSGDSFSSFALYECEVVSPTSTTTRASNNLVIRLASLYTSLSALSRGTRFR